MGPTTTSLPSFDDVIASMPVRRAHSMSSLKNGDTGYLIETKSVFFYYFHGCLFCFLNFYPICSDILPLLSRPAQPSKHIPSSNFQEYPCDLVSISSLVYSASQSMTSNRNPNSLSPQPAAHSRIHWLHTLGCSRCDCVSQKRSHDLCIFVVLMRRRKNVFAR